MWVKVLLIESLKVWLIVSSRVTKLMDWFVDFTQASSHQSRWTEKNKYEIILKWRWNNNCCWSGYHHLPRHLLWCLRHCKTVRRRETKYFGSLLHRSGKFSLQNIILISDWLTHININLWLVDRLWLLDLLPWLIHSTLSGGDWWWWVEKRRKCTSKSTILISHWPIE